MKKKIAIFTRSIGDWFAWFELPEGFEEAQEAHETDWGFNLLDWPCENPETNFIGFLDSEHFLLSEEEEKKYILEILDEE